METHETNQHAYAGQYSLRNKETGKLLHGGGVDAPRPRLYETPEAATEAAEAIEWAECEPVQLVATDDDG